MDQENYDFNWVPGSNDKAIQGILSNDFFNMSQIKQGLIEIHKRSKIVNQEKLFFQSKVFSNVSDENVEHIFLFKGIKAIVFIEFVKPKCLRHFRFNDCVFEQSSCDRSGFLEA